GPGERLRHARRAAARERRGEGGGACRAGRQLRDSCAARLCCRRAVGGRDLCRLAACGGAAASALGNTDICVTCPALPYPANESFLSLAGYFRVVTKEIGWFLSLAGSV